MRKKIVYVLVGLCMLLRLSWLVSAEEKPSMKEPKIQPTAVQPLDGDVKLKAINKIRKAKQLRVLKAVAPSEFTLTPNAPDAKGPSFLDMEGLVSTAPDEEVLMFGHSQDRLWVHLPTVQGETYLLDVFAGIAANWNYTILDQHLKVEDEGTLPTEQGHLFIVFIATTPYATVAIAPAGAPASGGAPIGFVSRVEVTVSQ